jgi:hypothetical protein
MPRPAAHGPTTLEGAFRALGPAPTDRELQLVRKALAVAGVDSRNVSFEELVELAERSGATAFTALDLITEPVGSLGEA